MSTSSVGLIPTFITDLLSRSSYTIDFEIHTPVATLAGAWHDRVSAGAGWPCVSIL